MEGSLRPPAAIGDPRLVLLFQYWTGKRQGRAMPAPEDVGLAALPASLAPNTMLLDVVREAGTVRFRYSNVGRVFWRAAVQEPVGRYVDEALPETAGYRDYVVGIYREMEATRRPMYTENQFVLRHGQSDPMATKRLSLPLARKGGPVEMVLAAHVFDYGSIGDNSAFALVTGLKEGVRCFLD